MKIKVIIMFILCVILTGCVNVNDMSYDDIIDIFSTKEKRANVSRTGYKYYLPSGMRVSNYTLYNEVIVKGNNKYYLFVDMIKYINKMNKEYEFDDNSYYKKEIKIGDKTGYVDITSAENNKYLIEIMYNYAKIEVMVEEMQINEALLYSVNILNSIKYNDDVINNLLNNDMLNYTEEEFDLFESGVDFKSKLEYADDEDNNDENDDIVDTDYVN